jgi:GNAT superfamily N-acetyltransferase
MRELNIRPATPDDIPEILTFIRELADYEHVPAEAVATPADLLRDGFGPTPRFHCFIAEVPAPAPTPSLAPRTSRLAAPAGFALYFHNYSTWRGHAGIYLEDLFVRPAFRHRGIGTALLSAVAAVAVAEGCPRLEWAVLDWNTPAIDFYHSLGAVMQPQWRIMRVSGNRLQALAAARP